MRVSVVVSTFNRAAGLRQTLDSFRHQTYPDFEVVVVNGPSTDGTAAVLAEYADLIKIGKCEKPRLCVSRNIGLGLADGEVVAFIDDDAIPEPTWLEHLVAAYDHPTVGAAGGIVYDHTGVRLQYKYAVCSRVGVVRLDVEPPLDEFTHPKADPFVYMQGTNMSFRRAVLAAVGGFDENILHYYDDVEIALRVIDHGYTVRPLPNAGVHHKYLASHVRTPDRVTLDPYNLVCDRIYFALQHGRGTHPTREILDWVVRSAETAKAEAAHFHAVGKMTAEQRAFHAKRVDEALEVGLPKGLNGRRASVDIPGPAAGAVPPAPDRTPGGEAAQTLLSVERVPARRLRRGRPVHRGAGDRVRRRRTRGPRRHRVAGHPAGRLRAGRLGPPRAGPGPVGAGPRRRAVDAQPRPHGGRLPRSPPDSRPSPRGSGLRAALAQRRGRLPTRPAVPDRADADDLPEGDQRHAPVVPGRPLHPPANSPRRRDRGRGEARPRHQPSHFGPGRDGLLRRPGRAFVAPLGLADRRPQFPRKRPADGRVRILFVGRLEVRKGADLMLAAAVELSREFPHAEFVLAGKDTPHTELGETYRARFERDHGADPTVAGRVRFTGMLSETELFQAYSDCDVFCLPSRYESFGLVFVEAMMFGVPVVGCRTGGMVEVIADGTTGYLTPPDDVEGLIAALRKLIADSAHRTALGAAARTDYETRFALPVVVGQTEAEFRRVIAKHRSEPGTDPLAAPPDERIAAGLAGVIARSAGLAADAARRAADRLLDPVAHPIDFYAPLAQAAGMSDAEFAAAAFRTILGREPSSADAGHWAHVLYTLRGDRRELVRQLIAGWESKHNGIPPELADRLHLVLPPAQPSVSAVTPAPADPEEGSSVRGRLSGLPLVGKGFKYVRRVLMLPWNFHKFYSGYGPTADAHAAVLRERVAAVEAAIDARVLPLIRELAEKTDHLREQVAARDRAAMANQREMRAAVDDHLARLANALADVAEAVSDDDTPVDRPVLLPRLNRAAG